MKARANVSFAVSGPAKELWNASVGQTRFEEGEEFTVPKGGEWVLMQRPDGSPALASPVKKKAAPRKPTRKRVSTGKQRASSRTSK